MNPSLLLLLTLCTLAITPLLSSAHPPAPTDNNNNNNNNRTAIELSIVVNTTADDP